MFIYLHAVYDCLHTTLAALINYNRDHRPKILKKNYCPLLDYRINIFQSYSFIKNFCVMLSQFDYVYFLDNMLLHLTFQ